MSPARLWLGMAATQQGGRRPGAGRPRFVPAASKRPARAVLKFDKELHSQLEHLEAAGRISLGLTVCGASSLWRKYKKRLGTGTLPSNALAQKEKGIPLTLFS